MTQKNRSIVLGGACALAFLVPACSSDSKTSTTAAPVAPSATDGTTSGSAGLTISGNSFSVASVPAGTALTITNQDGVAHTVTDDAGDFSVDAPAGGTATLTIPTAGTYQIHCNIHSSMHGTITVT
ncbi:MAG: cupredoxin domain-containing protein [Ilumatobacteraceae bacterium]